MRIVSLLPAATEIVCALGLGDDLVGISHACDHPPEIAGTAVVTRLARSLTGLSSGQIDHAVRQAMGDGAPLVQIDDDALLASRPDLVLTQDVGPACAPGLRQVSEAIAGYDLEVRVLSLDPTSLEGIFHAISAVGAMAEAEDEAVDLLEELRDRLGRVERRVQERRDAGHRPPRVVGLDWFDPPFAAGHWVPEQIRRAGGWDLLGHEGEPSAETTWEAVRDVDPEMLVLMACGLRVREAVEEWARVPRPGLWREIDAVRRGQVFVVDGSAYFSRPGPRVIDGIELLAEIFDPAAFEEQAPFGSWTPVS